MKQLKQSIAKSFKSEDLVGRFRLAAGSATNERVRKSLRKRKPVTPPGS